MSKTELELTCELTIAYIQSWNSKSTNAALKIDDTKNVFESFKKLVTDFYK